MIFDLILYFFALTGIGFAIYQTSGVIKAKREHRKKVKEFDNMCKNVLDTLHKYKIDVG